ncbi:hypothetical protein BMF94_0979 [Rhodotorula taiwanensis]|uniref:Uncharacterized protein n=1 Tax=Rhodotorula taiwanensis TaxID=741276 RepID=A0A2S5BGJ7_9BASI|nr:hypothetical protein BMF94_0979 [Rhodotorula taiwanensis]
MSATRLSSTQTTLASPYAGSIRLAGGIDTPTSAAPQITAADTFHPYTIPPKGALVFQQHVHRYPKPMRRSQKVKLWYRGVFWETLEPWENYLVHALLFTLMSILYFAVSRVFAPSHLTKMTGRAQWYLTGVASVASNPANATMWPHL